MALIDDGHLSEALHGLETGRRAAWAKYYSERDARADAVDDLMGALAEAGRLYPGLYTASSAMWDLLGDWASHWHPESACRASGHKSGYLCPCVRAQYWLDNPEPPRPPGRPDREGFPAKRGEQCAARNRYRAGRRRCGNPALDGHDLCATHATAAGVERVHDVPEPPRTQQTPPEPKPEGSLPS